MEVVESKRVVYEFGRFVLDPRERILLADGVPVHLAPKEFETLLLFLEHNGRALTKDEIMSAVWRDSFVDESNLARQISRLRKVLNTNGEQLIETIPKYGYRFSVTLRQAAVGPDGPVVLEQHTLRRLTLEIDDDVSPLPALLPPHKGRHWSVAFGLLLLTSMTGLGYAVWRLYPTQTPTIDPYAPVRLTNDPNDDIDPAWTKDGRIRFARIYGDRRGEILTMNPDGSGQTVFKQPEGRQILSISPDEKKILFRKPEDPTKHYISNADGSDETLLPCRGGPWSADSKMIACHLNFSQENRDIAIYRLDTGELKNITNSPAFDADPSFSPDGKQIVFDSNRDGNQELYLANLDGGGLRRLTFDPAAEYHPAFSPDGTQISFGSNRENENGDLYLMNSDGSGYPVKLTHLDKSNETATSGCWSPDGTKIAFYSDINGNDDIYVVSAETVRPKLLLSDPEHDLRVSSYSPDGRKVVYSSEFDDKTGELKILDLEKQATSLVRKTELPVVSADWSLDGNWIVFADRVNGNSDVLLVKPEGGELRNLTNDPSPDSNPSFSPDGNRIVFLSGRGEPPGTMQLFVMNADGSNPRAITPRKGFEGDPAWATNNQIIFVCDRLDSPGNLLDICQINVDGSGEKRVLFHRDHDYRPAVSPDGDRIAFGAASDGNIEIYLMNSDGSGLVRLTRDPAIDAWPQWSPDGKTLAFISNRGGKFAIYEIDV